MSICMNAKKDWFNDISKGANAVSAVHVKIRATSAEGLDDSVLQMNQQIAA